MENIYEICFYGGLILAIIFLITSVVLFIVLKIPKVVGDLTGRTAKKTIKEMKEGTPVKESVAKKEQAKYYNQQTGKIKVRESATVDMGNKSGTDMTGDEATDVLNMDGEEVTDVLAMEGEEATDVLAMEEEEATDVLTMEGEEATDVLTMEEEATDVLTMEEEEATDVLRGDDESATTVLTDKNIFDSRAKTHRVKYNVISIHTDETL